MYSLTTRKLAQPISRKMRFLSAQGEDALKKFQDVMSEYRRRHYAQEMPRRFKRDVVAAAKDSENRIVMEGMQRVLKNIGAGQKLSENELKTLFTELGENGVISVSRMSALL
mmetsp:Transcript_10387/g.15952  ORF Transcript_10387/g.15952 Transcript_10387/m.15952 type:complete len:112 (-) Transcript_10387:129-464(-)